MIDFKPTVRPFMSAFDRIKWMGQISHGIQVIEQAHDSGLISDQSFFDWMLLRNAELKWNEFYMPTIKLNQP